MVKAFGWSLYEIDRTDIESLLPFILRACGENPNGGTAYCDEVSWL